jgi:homoserine O-acetyltransferase
MYQKAFMNQPIAELRIVRRPPYESVPGNTRQYVHLAELNLEDGSSLSPATIAYESWGTLNPEGDNAILLCHALTGDAHAHDPSCPDDPRAAWWNPLIGPGRVLDTEQYFIVCSNILGGCYGTTGPTSLYPEDDQPYRLRFPMITIGDMVHAQHAMLEQLGVRCLAAVIGGSVGGLQALEWTVAYPDMVDRAIIIAAAPRLSAQGLAIDDIGRQAIMNDPSWQNGDYPLDQGPTVGLSLARMVAMLTYTSAEGLEERFGRRFAAHSSQQPSFGPRRDVETYLHYQGEKLVRRFDANTYLYLTSAMDRYDTAEKYGSDIEPFARIKASTLCVGISSDWLYPPSQVCALAQDIEKAGGTVQYKEIESHHGHDAFLQEWDQLDNLIRSWFNE